MSPLHRVESAVQEAVGGTHRTPDEPLPQVQPAPNCPQSIDCSRRLSLHETTCVPSQRVAAVGSQEVPVVHVAVFAPVARHDIP
jgi:hypothetical protein